MAGEVELIAEKLKPGGLVAVAHNFRPEVQSTFNRVVAELNAFGLNVVDFGGSCTEALIMGARLLGIPMAMHVLSGGVRTYMLERLKRVRKPIYVGWREVGRTVDLREFEEYYFLRLRGRFPRGLLSGKNVVVDLSGGAYQRILPRVLSELGARVTTLNALPEAPEKPSIDRNSFKELLKAVESWEADLGILVNTNGDGLGLILDGQSYFGGGLLKFILGKIENLKSISKCVLPVDVRGMWICEEQGLIIDEETGVPSPIITVIEILTRLSS